MYWFVRRGACSSLRYGATCAAEHVQARTAVRAERTSDGRRRARRMRRGTYSTVMHFISHHIPDIRTLEYVDRR